MDVTWITDDDSIVANAGRLDDVHQFAARLSAVFVPHQLGVFAMNTVSFGSEPADSKISWRFLILLLV